METIKTIESLPEEITIEGNFQTRDVLIDGLYLDPKPSQEIYNHSPDGFNWGYGGSGPAQLALAILLKYLPAEAAKQFYQDFKWNVIAGLPREDIYQKIKLRAQIKNIINIKSYIINIKS